MGQPNPDVAHQPCEHGSVRKEREEFKTAIRQLSENTDLDKFFAYGYGRNHFWLKQRLYVRYEQAHGE